MQIWQLADAEYVEWFPTEAAALDYLAEMEATIGPVDGMRPTRVELPDDAAGLCDLVNGLISRAARM